MIRIGIDPGVHECGVAIEWYHAFPEYGTARRTYSAFMVRSDAEVPLQLRARRMAVCIEDHLHGGESETVYLCVEGQQIYKSEKSKGDPKHMINLATVAGILVGALCVTYDATVEIPLPRQWKGGIDKARHHVRLARDFPHWVEPVAADTPPSLQNHVWDAVGLLEWHRKRTET